MARAGSCLESTCWQSAGTERDLRSSCCWPQALRRQSWSLQALTAGVLRRWASCYLTTIRQAGSHTSTAHHVGDMEAALTPGSANWGVDQPMEIFLSLPLCHCDSQISRAGIQTRAPTETGRCPKQHIGLGVRGWWWATRKPAGLLPGSTGRKWEVGEEAAVRAV